MEEVKKMDDSEWLKKCLKEEIRRIINGDATKWETELRGYGRSKRRGHMEYNKKWRLIRQTRKKSSYSHMNKNGPRNSK